MMMMMIMITVIIIVVAATIIIIIIIIIVIVVVVVVFIIIIIIIVLLLLSPFHDRFYHCCWYCPISGDLGARNTRSNSTQDWATPHSHKTKQTQFMFRYSRTLHPIPQLCTQSVCSVSQKHYIQYHSCANSQSVPLVQNTTSNTTAALTVSLFR